MTSVLRFNPSAAELSLIATTLFYFAMNGAQIFETAVLVPKWTIAPPDSFMFFRGPYSIDLKTFWIAVHSLHEITFLLAIALCWKLDVRNALLTLFALHFAVRVWTLTYFAPEILNFEHLAQTGQTVDGLVQRVDLWKKLNYVRVAAFIAVSFAMIPLCVRAART